MDAAQERSQRQSDSVYRWIKLHSEPPRKPEAAKPRARPDASPLATRKPEARDASGLPEPAPAPVADASPPSDPGTAAPVTVESAAAPSPAPATSAPVAPAVLAEVEEDLKPIAQPQPDIPRELRAGVANGRVTLGFTVQPDGSVAEATVLRTSNRRLSKPALDAVAQWRFAPIRVARAAQVEIEFSPP